MNIELVLNIKGDFYEEFNDTLPLLRLQPSVDFPVIPKIGHRFESIFFIDWLYENFNDQLEKEPRKFDDIIDKINDHIYIVESLIWDMDPNYNNGSVFINVNLKPEGRYRVSYKDLIRE